MHMVNRPTTLREVGQGRRSHLHGDRGRGSRPAVVAPDLVERFRRMAERERG
jgi:hypothetical protein